jgi:hypothetical protein
MGIAAFNPSVMRNFNSVIRRAVMFMLTIGTWERLLRKRIIDIRGSSGQFLRRGVYRRLMVS